MNKVNVTEYKTGTDDCIVYYGRAEIKKGYAFADGDENFYQFIGKNSCYAIPELLHPDDVEEFLDTAKRLDEGRQCIIVRLKNSENHYKLLYMELWENGVLFDDFKSFTMEFCSLTDIKDKYVYYVNVVKKYREFMSLSSNLFFEYTFETDELKIYRYANIKCQPMLVANLDELRESINGSVELNSKSKGEFEVLYDFLKKGVDCFNASVNADLVLQEAQGRYAFKGRTLYDNDSRVAAIGIIDVVDAQDENKSYYLTDSAYDPGTGLLNKRAIHEYAVERTQAGKTLYLAMIDVDDFKKINDSYGHMFGDEVLSKVAEIMRSVLDVRGMVGRFGGDEFMIVFDSITEEEGLRLVLKTICKHIEWAFKDLKDSMTITISCGIAKLPDDGTTFEELLKKADKALYIAKEKGKNRFIIYDEKKHGDVADEKMTERSIGIKAIASTERKAEVMSKQVIKLYKNGTAALMEVMEKMRSYFDIDGVAVYHGSNMKRALSSGKYINPVLNLTCIDSPAYRELFNANGVFFESNVKRMKNVHAEAYQLYELQETCELIQCIAFKEGKPEAVVSFDFFNRLPKIGTTDLGFITIVGKLMAEVACGLD